MKTYKINMTHYQHYFVEVKAKTEEQAREHARFYLSPEDCKRDDYAEWEVYSVDEVNHEPV